jgi:hypothetical protein
VKVRTLSRERKEGGRLSRSGLSKAGCEVTSRGAVGALRGLCGPLGAAMEVKERTMMREYRLQQHRCHCGGYASLSPTIVRKGSLLVWRFRVGALVASAVRGTPPEYFLARASHSQNHNPCR